MGKENTNSGIQNRAIYSRVSFLYQAAAFLSSSAPKAAPDAKNEEPAAAVLSSTTALAVQGISRRLTTDLRAVSLKTRIRLTPAMKHAICKFCDSVLIEGQSCTSSVENQSRGGRKPWADVLVRKCHTCGRERRYPVNAPKPKRKSERGNLAVETTVNKEREPRKGGHGG